MFTRYTLTSAHVSIIPEFLDKISTANLQDDFYITKDEIINKKTGSKILFKGIKTSSGNQTANLKSLSGITCFVLDEAEELVDEDIFDKIDFSIRSQIKQNRIMLVLNPATKESWIYNRFFESKGIKEGSNIVVGNTTYIHTTYLDNTENLSESFLTQVETMKTNNVKRYEHVILGGWLDKAEGVVFDNWEFGDFNPNNLQTTFGQDFGFSVDPTTLIEVAIDTTKKIIYVRECFYKNKLDTNEIFELNKHYAKNNLIIADSAEPRLISELKRKGNNIKEAEKGQGSISAGIMLLLEYKIIVEHNSSNIAKELNNYTYADKTSKLVIDDFNHAIDPLRYVATFKLTTKSKSLNVKI